MKKLMRGVGFTLTAAAGLMLTALVVVGTSRAQTLPADAKTTCTVSAPVFKSWFALGSVSLNGVVNPANSVTFPNVPNCSFYQWSEQMFLWLLSPAPSAYGGGAHIFDSPAFYDVSPPDGSGNRTFIPHVPGKIRVFNLRDAKVGFHGLPVIFDKAGRMLEVERPKLGPTGRQLILNQSGQQIEIGRVTLGPDKKPVFMDKAGKVIPKPQPIFRKELITGRAVQKVQKFMIDKIPVFLDPAGKVVDVEQGQADDGVLQAQNGSLVYYALMVNDVFAYFRTGAEDGGILPKPTKFPTTQADLNKIVAFASSHGKTFPDPNALAIEVKSSWVEAAGLANLSSYVTMKATIPTYNKSNPDDWVVNGQKTVLLALTGIHVVGSTAGHPEMIWATFEHFGNTPNATYKYVDSSNATKTVTSSTAGTWLFAASNSAAPFNVVHMQSGGTHILRVSPFHITPSNTMRMKVWGGGFDFSPNPLDASTAASNSEIISINNSVRGQLAAGDVRANYFMIGSTWTIGGASPSGPFKSGAGNEVGTSQLANTTMETYQQGGSNLWSAGANCFSCHGSNTTSVSHIYPFLKPLF